MRRWDGIRGAQPPTDGAFSQSSVSHQPVIIQASISHQSAISQSSVSHQRGASSSSGSTRKRKAPWLILKAGRFCAAGKASVEFVRPRKIPSVSQPALPDCQMRFFRQRLPPFERAVSHAPTRQGHSPSPLGSGIICPDCPDCHNLKGKRFRHSSPLDRALRAEDAQLGHRVAIQSPNNGIQTVSHWHSNRISMLSMA